MLRKGRFSVPYRILFASGAEQPARESYERTARTLRQGVVLLIGPTGEWLRLMSRLALLKVNVSINNAHSNPYPSTMNV